MGIVKPLTIKQKKFVNALVQNPTSATKAAMVAGYSKVSARVTASRLMQDERIQSAIEQHFIDEQDYVRLILKKTLRHIDATLDDEDEATKEKTKAAKLGLEYTRLAAGILGLDVKKRPQPFEEVEAMTAEELKRNLLIELEHVDKYLLPPANPKSTPDVTTGESRDELRGASEGMVTPPRMPAETSHEPDVADETDGQAVPGEDAVLDAEGPREKHRRVAPDLNKTRLGSYVSDFPLTRPTR